MFENKADIKKNIFDMDDLIVKLKNRGFEYSEGEVYIIPEFFGDDFDILNDLASDIRGELKDEGLNPIVVRGSKYKLRALRSADLIIPYIIGVPFSVWANFITDYLKKVVTQDDVDRKVEIKIRCIRKKDGSYEKIEIEGERNGVLEALKVLQNEEKN